MSELDLGFVRHALEVARKHGFAEVELSVGDDTFSACLAPGRANIRGINPVGAASSSSPTNEDLPAIKATLVGYYREAATPLRVGRSIRKGDVVAVIEALGLANDVESTLTGEVAEVLVQPGQAVQYGEPIALVRPL